MTHDAKKVLRFYQLTAAWKNDTIHISNVDAKHAHPAYQAIIAMGPDVLPLIFAELQREPDDWFAALLAITGENPVAAESPKTLNEKITAWLTWAKEHGYSDGTFVEEGLPQSQWSTFFEKSKATLQYNCIAFALNDTMRRWWPGIHGEYWPSEEQGVPQEATVEAFVAAFRMRGYARCDTNVLEKGFEKIAIYVNPSTQEPTHAAHQLSIGK